MKYAKYLIALALPAVALTACSDDDGWGDNGVHYSQMVICRSQSIAEMSTVNPAATPAVTLSFNNLIEVTGNGISLNGTAVTATAKGMDVEIALPALTPYTEYTLTVPAGAIAIKGKNATNTEAIVINFNTNFGVNPENVAQQLVNSNASAEAKAVYTYLRNNYTKTMLSGAMGGVGWETAYTDLIASEIGRYPAVVGFDYLHLPSSPSNWIDYGDITPVKKVWDGGSLVEIQWHWNVPTSEGGTELSFRADGNAFNAANVTKEGTWENGVAKADIAKVAAYLQLLKDANIPVLWRPFHEAAGDYTWGAWFWWGAQGTEVTKQLYAYLYDQLTNVYSLNNLIWVWTVQTSDAGAPADIEKIKAAYPGDEYVDIVGTDLYPSEMLTDQTAQFNLVNSIVESKKIVALTECGNLIDPNAASATGALWSYYMQWYDLEGEYGHYNYPGEQWMKVCTNPTVICAPVRIK